MRLAILVMLTVLATTGCAPEIYRGPWPADDFWGYKGVGGP